MNLKMNKNWNKNKNNNNNIYQIYCTNLQKIKNYLKLNKALLNVKFPKILNK